ncbi:hypothetical protein PFISCL1PPCAC_8874 [Pristionchus fissidentatus]|uniref:Uncharacterized protein n=1 Tax=Pristionchus fissidentatus TaxID=1538716 RepID=A0AAV5VHI1_9BILA|nr:hypothetical protein PFISCL1PPCAC_8874 [Pristionchus fissidentatus]
MKPLLLLGLFACFSLGSTGFFSCVEECFWSEFFFKPYCVVPAMWCIGNNKILNIGKRSVVPTILGDSSGGVDRCVFDRCNSTDCYEACAARIVSGFINRTFKERESRHIHKSSPIFHDWFACVLARSCENSNISCFRGCEDELKARYGSAFDRSTSDDDFRSEDGNVVEKRSEQPKYPSGSPPPFLPDYQPYYDAFRPTPPFRPLQKGVWSERARIIFRDSPNFVSHPDPFL